MTQVLLSYFRRPFNFDVFCFNKKFLVYNLVSRDLKIKYRRSYLGFFWTIFQPLSLCLIYYIVFKLVLRVQIPHYVAFILSGVIPWNFFASSVIEGTETLTGNRSLLTKVPIPTQVFPFVACITNFVTFILALPIVGAIAASTGVRFNFNLLLLPMLSIILFIMAHSLTLIISVLYVYLKDLKHAITLIIQLWFYATPIIYPEEMIPPSLAPFLYLNPVGLLFSWFHKIFLGQTLDSVQVLVILAWAFIFWISAVVIHSRYSPKAVEFL